MSLEIEWKKNDGKPNRIAKTKCETREELLQVVTTFERDNLLGFCWKGWATELWQKKRNEDVASPADGGGGMI